MTSPRLIFEPVFSVWMVGAISALFLVFCLWKEIARKQRFVVARIVANVMLMIAVVGLFLRPSLREEKSSSNSILLTEGYTRSKADSLVRLFPDVKVFQTADVNAFPEAETIANDQELKIKASSLRFILGKGLSQDQLDLIDVKNFEFLPGEPSEGITTLDVGNKIIANRPGNVSGVLRTTEDGWLAIVGPAGTEDSVAIKKGNAPFSLSIKPRQAGLFIYTVFFKGNKNSWKESLPVEVLNEQHLRILVLQKFPTAEIRYLKNFLSEKGHALSIRYQTSKSNFKYEFSNTPNSKIDKITPALASSFDLIFIDSSVLAELGSAEKDALESAIHNGLGIIILDVPDNIKTIARFLPIVTKPFPSDTVHIQLAGLKKYILPAQPITIGSDPSIQPITKHHDRILSGYRFAGAGKVGFQLLQETYRAQLEGNIDDYMAIWSSLIERTARSKAKSFNVSIANAFPFYNNESLNVDIISSGQVPTLLDNTIQIPLTEDVLIDDLWSGKTWAGQPGWHKFVIQQDSTTINYFVSEENDWKSLRFNNQMKSNLLRQQSTGNALAVKEFDSKPVSPIIFFIMFLVACGFLWLAPKI